MITQLGRRNKFHTAIINVLAALVTFLIVLSVVGKSAATEHIVTEIGQSKYAGQFIVPIHKSQVLRLDVPFTDLLVGMPVGQVVGRMSHEMSSAEVIYQFIDEFVESVERLQGMLDAAR